MGEVRSGDVRIGLSGWRYREWRGRFYPPGLPQRRELEYVAAWFDTVEINGSFYSLQRPASYRHWAACVPDRFTFAVKGGRYITHLLKLAGVQTALANFFASGLLALGPKLGPVLWQLPPRLRFDPARLEAFLAQLPRTTVEAARLARGHDARFEGRTWTETDAARPVRHALEVRDESFRDPALLPLLERYGVGLVVADTAGRWPLLLDVTADLVYVRLHGDVELYTSGYGEEALDRWASRVRDWAAAGLDVHVYFDNDVDAHAPFDAAGLARRLGVGPVGVAGVPLSDPPPSVPDMTNAPDAPDTRGTTGTDVPDPSTWRTGDEPPTHRQQAYLETLAQEAGEELPESLTKAEASEKIDELRDKTGRD